MHIEIWHLEGEGRGQAGVFESGDVRIGSDASAHIALTASAGVLPLHATVTVERGAAWLRPAGTVQLNGNPADAAVRLSDGDVISIGDDVLLRVRLRDGVKPLPAKTGRFLRGAPVAGVTALFLAILVAGTYLAARAPARAESEATRERQEMLRVQRQRAYEARIRRLHDSLASLEARVDDDGKKNERRLGQVKRAVAEVETSVLERVSTEVKRSLVENPELAAARAAVQRIESADGAAERIIAELGGSVCVIQGAYGFGKKHDGKFRFLREASPEMLNGLEISRDKVPLMLEGDGPIFRVEYTGTGFLVDKRGIVITNRHIAEPWWKNGPAQPLLRDGYEPRFLYLRAYFPGRKEPVAFRISQTILAKDADLGALFFKPEGKLPRPLRLAGPSALKPGRRVLLLGYPSGLDALLARTDETSDELVHDDDPLAILDFLAERGFVRPLPTQGHIGDVLGDRVVFDAPTAVGGSGGPLVDMTGRVVAVNYGILKAFSGANFGVPVDRASKLLKRAQAAVDK